MTSSGNPVPTVSAARLRRDLEHVAGYGATPSGGVSRTSFSELIGRCGPGS